VAGIALIALAAVPEYFRLWDRVALAMARRFVHDRRFARYLARGLDIAISGPIFAAGMILLTTGAPFTLSNVVSWCVGLLCFVLILWLESKLPVWILQAVLRLVLWGLTRSVRARRAVSLTTPSC
jgi:hypothetical protein